MDINDPNHLRNVRRKRLRELVRSHFGGRQSAFASAIERSPSYVARLFSDNPSHARNIGESLARQIEGLCNLPSGWLDRSADEPAAAATSVSSASDGAVSPALNVKEWVSTDDHEYEFRQVSIPVLEIPESWGGRQREIWSETPVRGITIDLAWLRRSMSMTDISNLRVSTGLGDSMTPTIKHGDTLIVDVGVQEALYDGVYVVQIGSVLTIKRIQRDMNGMRILSDNQQFKEVLIPLDMEDRVKVVARVVYIWSGSRV
ncbi:S24 family peptidase [Pseudomonas monteilii]|uniref:S24 family peptidase n=1 Tax=Pseudomonas monteilii TaxID=76759 RepID=UPI0006768454|nr:S24 family peptidase [Pseudomonas monteilii]